MSRRHKEKEIPINYKPQQAESQADVSQRVECLQVEDDSILFDIKENKCNDGKFRLSLSLMDAILKVFANQEFVVDKDWVKLPRSAFDDGWLKYFRKAANPSPEEEPKKKRKKGRNPIKRLINKIADSKVVELFRETMDGVKEKCVELWMDITQYTVCFLQGIHKAFAPDEDPYGKITHYHNMLKDEVRDLPSRKTIDFYIRWYENWRPIVFNELPKEKNERHKHGIWKQLIEWIFYYLQKIAPEYAVQMQRG